MPSQSATSQRARQRETTRRQLVDAGLRVVAASGFAGASTAAIAKATGKAHGTVFVHFRTRDDLVAELVAEIGRAMSARLATPEAATLPEVLQAHLAALADQELLYARMLCEASTLPLAARAQIFELQSGVAARIRSAYLRTREQGALREIDPVMLSNMWISLTNHYVMNRDLFAPGGSPIATHGEAIKAQFLNLIQQTEVQP